MPIEQVQNKYCHLLLWRNLRFTKTWWRQMSSPWSLSPKLTVRYKSRGKPHEGLSLIKLEVIENSCFSKLNWQLKVGNRVFIQSKSEPLLLSLPTPSTSLPLFWDCNGAASGSLPGLHSAVENGVCYASVCVGEGDGVRGTDVGGWVH